MPIWRQFKIDVPLTRWRRANEARTRSDAIVHAEIRRRRAMTGSPVAGDILDLLIAATTEDGSPALSDEALTACLSWVGMFHSIGNWPRL